MRFKACVLAGLLLWSSSVIPLFSQSRDAAMRTPLKGVQRNSVATTLSIYGDGRSQRSCLIKRQELYTDSLCGVLADAGFVPLGNTSCNQGTSNWSGHRGQLWMSVQVKIIRDVCVGMLKLEMMRQLRTPEDTPDILYPNASVWEMHEIVNEIPPRFHDVLQYQAEDLTKEFLIQWLEDNP